MSDKSKIEWTDSTFNPWIGCTKVSPGCDHCYAEAWDRRFAVSGHAMRWGAGKLRTRTSAANWKLPLRWNAKRFMECGECGWRGECAAELIACGACGSISSMNDVRRRVFCASLGDVFDNEAPTQWRWELFELIRATPDIDWLLLTKRIGNARKMLNAAAAALDGDFVGAETWDRAPWPNVWLGATIVNQEEADRDIPKLLAVPATVRFLSIEPMLGPVNVGPYLSRTNMPGLDIMPGFRDPLPGINWVIAGGESGSHARPSHPAWFCTLRDQCAAAGVPFLFKQWGELKPILSMGADVTYQRVGKKAAGRLLDGVTHDGYPV